MKNNDNKIKKTVVIIGAGPAGLSFAYNVLSENNENDIYPVIVEELDVPGGLSRTINKNQNGLDIGPHRFFTKNNEVLSLWKKILPIQGSPSIDDKILNREVKMEQNGPDPEKSDKVFLKRKRFSRIYYKKHFIDYPIKLNPITILALGVPKTVIAGLSYIKSCLFKLPENNLETFMINRFGRVLYELFFEGYTEKVWGVPPSQISKEWGIQRIKGISILSILKNAVFSIFNIKNEKEISLIDEYLYPKLGSSQFYEELANEIEKKGGKILYNNKVVSLKKVNNKIISVLVQNTQTNEITEIKGDIFVSSMPVKELITEMNDVPENIVNIAKNLQYRDFILVNFIVNNINLKNNTNVPTVNNITPDSWIYLQDNGVKAGRLDIMNNFSPYIIKNFKEDVVINLEYFCNATDDIWNEKDENIIKFAVSELKELDIAKESNIKSSDVYRIKKAYPSYFGSYCEFNKIKEYINSLDNLYCIGRNGQHKYNNMDHSILSGIVASRIIKNNSDKNLLWDVNTDLEYQEIKSYK